MAFRWRADGGPTLNVGLVALRFFRGPGPVLLRNPAVVWFSRGGVQIPCPPSGSAHETTWVIIGGVCACEISIKISCAGLIINIDILTYSHARIQRGGTGGPDPNEKSPKYRVSYQYCSGSLENHKAAKARQQNATQLSFRWRTDDGTLKVVFGSALPLMD